MNGYLLIAESYRMLEKQGKIGKEEAERAVKVYEFLSTCSEDDLCEIIDSAAMNNIIRAFVKKSVCDAGLDTDTQRQVMGELEYMFDTKTAKEILDEIFPK